MPGLVKIGTIVLKKMKIWKVYRLTDNHTTGDQKSSLGMSIQVRLKCDVDMARSLHGCSIEYKID